MGVVGSLATPFASLRDVPPKQSRSELARVAWLDTQAVSGTGEGVHTTTRRQLLVLDRGAMLVTDQSLSGMAHNFVYARLIAGEVQSGASRWGLWGRGRGRAFV
jgi:hypothetical protein